jgi:protein-tyrosine phosphatase
MSYVTNLLPYAKGIANYALIPFRVGMDKTHDILINLTTNEKPPTNNASGEPVHDTPIVERINKSNFVYDHCIAWLPPTEVYPNLFLGSSYNAAFLSCLRARNIKYIINVTNEISNYYPVNMEYYNIPIRDNGIDNVHQYFNESYEVIDNFLNKNDGCVLVHCYMGASRSATIVANFIARKTGVTIDEVLYELRQQRGNVNPTKSLYKELKYTESPEDKV